jgi:uncharacterized protein YbcI
MNEVENAEGSVLLELSNAIVRINKEYFGRGPTKARAHIVGSDLVVCVLEGGMTRAEHTLVEHGHVGAVDANRDKLQEAVEREMRATVERIVGREVVSFMSANDAANDLQLEAFVLASEPLPHDASGEALAAEAAQARRQSERVREEGRALRAEHVQAREAVRQRRTFFP